MRRIGSWMPVAIALAAFTYVGILDARQCRADEEETAPAPPADEQQANVLGTPEPQDDKPNKGRISLVLESDFTTAYFFRGILQERNGFIWQPFAEIGFNLYEGGDDSALKSIDLGFGIWNSFHSNQTLAESGPANLYETDYYPSLSLTFPHDVSFSMTYFVYTSPNGAFSTVQNFDMGLAYDDSELWGGGFSMGPSITVSFETDNTNFGDDTRGSWLGLNAAPTVVAFEGDAYPLTLALPLALGLSISDYYKVPGEGDDTFGFFSFGLSASVPLAFIPTDYGSWSANAGVNVLVLGDNLKEANLGDEVFPVGLGGIRMEY